MAVVKLTVLVRKMAILFLSSIIQQLSVSLRCFDSQNFPIGEIDKSLHVRICLLAVPGDALGIEVTCHEGRDWTVELKDAMNFR